MKHEVIQKGSAILRKRCKFVSDFKNIQTVVTDLIDTIDYLKTTYDYPRGIGLAAPQIGELQRISVVEETKGKRYVMINPKIIDHSKGKKTIREGCISFLQFRGMTPRYEYVKVKAFDQNGNEYILEGEGSFAMLLQHEIDHLDGILYYDRLPNKENDLFTITV